MAETYYVDGYNVLHKSSLLRPLADEDFESARDALIEKVAAFCAASGKRAVLVFDGRGRQQPQVQENNLGVKNLEILYGPGNLTADAVIERLIYQTSNKLDAVVVSNDRGLRDLCRGMGALLMDADNYLATGREARSDVSAVLARTRRDTTLDHLEDRLSGDALRRLKELKNRL